MRCLLAKLGNLAFFLIKFYTIPIAVLIQARKPDVSISHLRIKYNNLILQFLPMVPDSQLRSESIFFMLVADEMIRAYRLLGSYRMHLASRIPRQDLKDWNIQPHSLDL